MRVALTPPALKRDRFCTVMSVSDTGDGDLVSFEGIDDLTAAEGITGCYVLANRDDFELDSLDAAYTDLMGREVVDERAYAYADERLSIGDYVLTGGELPAMVVADAVVRLIPGALGDEMSNVDESFSTAEDGGLLEYAQYTRPAEFNGEGVPPVLVSGDHAKVDAWRRKNAIERTCRWRPDLIETARLTPQERAYAQEILDASYSQSEE